MPLGGCGNDKVDKINSGLRSVKLIGQLPCSLGYQVIDGDPLESVQKSESASLFGRSHTGKNLNLGDQRTVNSYSIRGGPDNRVLCGCVAAQLIDTEVSRRKVKDVRVALPSLL